MSQIRLALANLQFPSSAGESIDLAQRAIEAAAAQRADFICFPECFVPGYRSADRPGSRPDAAFLTRAWNSIARTAGRARVTVVLGTERVADAPLPLISALVIDRNGTIDGFQDKVQLDPSEEPIYSAGSARRMFTAGDVTFGISICHEAFRYPETVRWPAQRGAQIVFHPQALSREPGGHRPTTYGEPANTFHESSIRCRAAENTCFFATVNYAYEGAPATSAIARPDGSILAYQPYGVPGLLVTDLDLTEATGLLASRLKPCE
jgi:predicted amidohydrolase